MKTTTTLMKGLPLSGSDAARLTLEMTEALGEKAQGLGKAQLMELMRRVMRAGIQALAAAENTAAFEEAAWASVEARSTRRPATKRDLRHFVRRMLRVPDVAQRPLRAMTPRECRALLQEAFGKSAHSYRKGRAILHSIFAYGYRQEWCDANPVDRIPAPPVAERPIRPLTMEEVNRLEAAVRLPEHRDMALSLHLMLYCGIRPTEVQRLDPENDIDWTRKSVLIRSRASKTGGGRMVPLRKAARLCGKGGRREWRIPANWWQKWRALRRAAGFRDWTPDVCRHTFATYHAERFKNLPALQLEMGHRDVNLLQTRYILPGTVQDAAEFWR